MHSYCTDTYTEVAVLFFWGDSAVTTEYLDRYSIEVPVWVLSGCIGANSKEQYCYFCVGTSAVTVQ